MLPSDKDKLIVAINAAAKLWEQDNTRAYMRSIDALREREIEVVSVAFEMLISARFRGHIDQVLVDVATAQSADLIERYLRYEGPRAHHGLVGPALNIMEAGRAAAAVLGAIQARRLAPKVGVVDAVAEGLVRESPDRCEEFCLAVLEFREDDKSFLRSVPAFVHAPTRRVIEAILSRLPAAMGEPPLSNSVYEAWCSPAAQAGCLALAAGADWRNVDHLLKSGSEALRVVAATMLVHDLGLRSPWLNGPLSRSLMPLANRPPREECTRIIAGSRVGQRVFRYGGLNPDGTPKRR